MVRKAATSTIELILRGIVAKTSHQFGCDKKIMYTLTHPFSSICSNLCNVGHKDSLFLLAKQPIIDISSRINEGGDDPICLFHEMSRMSPQPPVVEFSKLLSSTSNNEHYSVALWIFREMRQFGFPVNEHIMNIAIRCYCLQHEIDFAFATLGSFFKCGYKTDTETFNNIIRGLFLNNKVDEVAELFKKLLIFKLCKPGRVMIHTVINGLYECGHDHSAGYLLGLLEETSSEVYDYCNAIVGLRCNGLVDDALRLLTEVVLRGISPNILTIEGIYQFLGGSEDSSTYKGVLYHKKHLKNVASDVSMVALECKKKIMVMEKGDMGVLEIMVRKNYHESLKLQRNAFDDSFTCDMLINGYCYLGRVDKAKELFDSVVEMGHKPSILSYCGLIIENCIQGNVTEAWNLFLQVPCSGLEYNIITYNTMMYGLFREGRFDDGWKLFEEIKASAQVDPDLYTYDVLIYGLCKNRPIDEAFSFLGKMEEDESTVNPDISLYEILIDVLCEDGKPHVAIRDVLNKLPLKVLSPRRQTYNMILCSLCREGFVEEAKCLFMEMLKNGTDEDQRNRYGVVRRKRYEYIIPRFFEEMKMERKNISN